MLHSPVESTLEPSLSTSRAKGQLGLFRSHAGSSGATQDSGWVAVTSLCRDLMAKLRRIVRMCIGFVLRTYWVCFATMMGSIFAVLGSILAVGSSGRIEINSAGFESGHWVRFSRAPSARPGFPGFFGRANHRWIAEATCFASGTGFPGDRIPQRYHRDFGPL